MNPKNQYISSRFGDINSGPLSRVTSGISKLTQTPQITQKSKTPNMTLASSMPKSGNMTPANPSAVTTKPVTITPAKTNTQLPPSATPFIQNLQNNNQVLGTSSQASPTPQQTIVGDGIKTPISTPTSTESEYIKYLRTMFNPEETKMAQENLRSLNQSIGKETLRARSEEERINKNEIGALESGVNTRLGKLSSESGRTLADLALAKGVATDVYNSYINAGKSIQEAEEAAKKTQEGFTLGKDQIRYEKNPLTGQYEQVGGGISTTESDTGNAVVDAWVKGIQSGTYKPSDVPDELKNQVASALSTTEKPQSQLSKNVVSVIDELLSEPDVLNRISGPIDQYIGGILGPKAILAKNKFNQLKGLLSLENIKYLKGTGAISDAEQKILENAASAIGRNLYGAQLQSELQKLKQDLSVAKDNQLSPDEEQFLRSKGYNDEQINKLKTSFKSVGKTTASNIPQTNKNPGNLKKGGIADKLAIGIDKNGHLIFPDDKTGFNAMILDIQAKINGQSKYLPPNPTIEQLGKVYAEDPRWANGVSKILGIKPTTKTKTIPITNLVQAIARQEGYYA